LTHISPLPVATELKPFVGLSNDNTTVAGFNMWITALPVAVLNVNFMSDYTHNSYAVTLSNKQVGIER